MLLRMAQPSYKYLIFLCYFVHLFSICNLLYDIKHIFSDVLLLSLNTTLCLKKTRHLWLVIASTYDNFSAKCWWESKQSNDALFPPQWPHLLMLKTPLNSSQVALYMTWEHRRREVVWSGIQWGPEAKHGGRIGCKAPSKKLTTLCENMLFCHGFKNNIAIFAFIAYKC